MPSRPVATAILSLLLASTAVARDEVPEYVEGDRLIAKGEYEAALKHFDALHKKTPSDPIPLQRLSYTRIRMGGYVEAEKLARRAVEARGEPHAVASFLLGKALEGLGDVAGARQAFEEGAQAGYRTGDREGILGTLFCRFNAGLQAALAGEDERAVQHFGEVLKLDKKNAYARYELGLIALKEGRRGEALALFEEGLQNKLEWLPQEIWVYPVQRYVFYVENVKTRMAPLLIERERAAEAEQMLRAVHEEVARRTRSKPVEIARDPLAGDLDRSLEDAGYWLGTALASLGRREEARDVFKDWSRLRVGSTELREESKRQIRDLR